MGCPDEVKEEIRECLVDLDRDCVLEKVEDALSQGCSATELVLGPMSEAMQEIGRLYEEGEYFIAELMEAAEIFKEAMKRLKPLLQEEARRRGGGSKLRIVIGTVKGDIHDIGKSLVATMLEAAGYEVIDLGVDVPPEKFVEAVKKYKPRVLAMSALLTSTAKRMREVIDLLEKEGLRDKVYIIVGGAAVTPGFAEEIGADAYGGTAVDAVNIVKNISRRGKQGNQEIRGEAAT